MRYRTSILILLPSIAALCYVCSLRFCSNGLPGIAHEPSLYHVRTEPSGMPLTWKWREIQPTNTWWSNPSTSTAAPSRTMSLRTPESNKDWGGRCPYGGMQGESSLAHSEKPLSMPEFEKFVDEFMIAGYLPFDLDPSCFKRRKAYQVLGSRGVTLSGICVDGSYLGLLWSFVELEFRMDTSTNDISIKVTRSALGRVQ